MDRVCMLEAQFLDLGSSKSRFDLIRSIESVGILTWSPPELENKRLLKWKLKNLGFIIKRLGSPKIKGGGLFFEQKYPDEILDSSFLWRYFG